MYFGPASRTGLPVLFSGENWRRGWAVSRAHKITLPSLRTVSLRVVSTNPRRLAPRRTPGTVQRALLDGPNGQNLSLGPKKIFLLIRWSQSTRRSLSLKGLVKKVNRAFIMSVGKNLSCRGAEKSQLL